MSQISHQSSTATDNAVNRVMRIGSPEVSRQVESRLPGFLRLAYDFTDQNTASQALAKPKSCCNRIPGM